jgi:glycerol-3-phosphate dehydrogenase
VAFPGRSLDRSAVVGAFAGLRPILDTHAEDPSEASREEDIWHEHGLLSVAGGKLTTWRATAESAVDEVIELLPEERARLASRCATIGTALAGLAPRDLGTRLGAALAIEPAVATAAARRLGSLAWHLPLLAATPADLQPIHEAYDLSPAEVRAHLRWGAALHLDDLLLRRVRVGMWQPALALELLPALRAVLATEGWDSARWEREEEAFRQALEGWTMEGVRG